jgi:hypothetical protein
MVFKQYDVVKIVRLNKSEWAVDGFSRRPPQVGDIATIVELYASPQIGFELECVAPDGQPQWLHTVTPADIEFELMSRP